MRAPFDVRREARPRPRPGVEVIWIGDRAVLHDARSGEVVGLSHSAGVIWERCDGRATLHDIARELAGALGRPSDAVLQDVRAAVEHLHARGLLLVGAGDLRSEADELSFDVVFEGLVVRARIEGTGGVVLMRRIFHHLTDGAREWSAGWVGLEALDEGSFALAPEPARYPTGADRAEALGAAKRAIIDRFVGARPDLVWLHAGAVARGDEALVLAGGWGTGKTTFVTALCDEGWEYLSDEVVALDPSADVVHPFPLAPQPREAPGHEVTPERVRDFPRRVASLDPEVVRTRPARLAGVVLPAYRAGGSGELEAVDRLRAAMELAEHRLDRDRGADAFRQVCTVAGRARAYKLRYDDPTGALETLLRLTAEWPGAGAKAHVVGASGAAMGLRGGRESSGDEEQE